MYVFVCDRDTHTREKQQIRLCNGIVRGERGNVLRQWIYIKGKSYNAKKSSLTFVRVSQLWRETVSREESFAGTE